MTKTKSAAEVLAGKMLSAMERARDGVLTQHIAVHGADEDLLLEALVASSLALASTTITACPMSGADAAKLLQDAVRLPLLAKQFRDLQTAGGAS